MTSGGQYLHPRFTALLTGRCPAGPQGCLTELSGREEEVLRLVALGFGNKEIAARLTISVKTVETYKARAMEKICASSRVEIVRFALERGWFEKTFG